MSLYDLITFAILAHIHFDGVYKRAYRMFVDELGIFPKVRYNKMIERLNRYENLLQECLNLFQLNGLKIVDSKPIETKEVVRMGRQGKRGESSIIRERESVGFDASKKSSTLAIKRRYPQTAHT